MWVSKFVLTWKASFFSILKSGWHFLEFGFRQTHFHLNRIANLFFFYVLTFEKDQSIIQRDQPPANDEPEGPASCIGSSGGAGLLKRSSEGTGPLQMIIRRDRPLANDHPEGLTICKWSSGCAGLLQMIIRRDRLCCSLCFPPSNISEQNKDQNSDKRFALFNWSSFNCDWAQNAIPIPTKINVTQHLIPWPAIEWLLHLRCCNHVSNNGTVTSGSRVWNTHLWWKFLALRALDIWYKTSSWKSELCV